MNESTINPSKTSIYFVLTTSGVLLSWSALSSVFAWGPITASVITYSLYLAYWVFVWLRRDPLVFRLLLIGTVAGILELVTDDYLVTGINSLVYPKDEWIIWSSPAYMPLAWSNVLLQLGFIGVLLMRKFSVGLSSLILGLAGGMYIPLYEHLAKDAGWWWYHANTRMIFNAPVYVILCEALISLSLPLLALYAMKYRPKASVVLGGFLGIWIYISAQIAFNLVH
jgi:hypothetical protein